MNVWWLGPFQLTAWGEKLAREPPLARWFRAHWASAGIRPISLYFIWMLEAVGLAHSVKRPRAS